MPGCKEINRKLQDTIAILGGQVPSRRSEQQQPEDRDARKQNAGWRTASREMGCDARELFTLPIWRGGGDGPRFALTQTRDSGYGTILTIPNPLPPGASACTLCSPGSYYGATGTAIGSVSISFILCPSLHIVFSLHLLLNEPLSLSQAFFLSSACFLNSLIIHMVCLPNDAFSLPLSTSPSLSRCIPSYT